MQLSLSLYAYSGGVLYYYDSITPSGGFKGGGAGILPRRYWLIDLQCSLPVQPTQCETSDSYGSQESLRPDATRRDKCFICVI